MEIARNARFRFKRINNDGKIKDIHIFLYELL